MRAKIRLVWLGCLLCCFLLFENEAWSQSPGWNPPNPALYAYTATAVVRLNHEGVTSDNIDDRLAFFVGGEIRGLGVPVNFAGLGTLHFVTLYSNEGNKVMTVEVYNADDDEVYTAVSNFRFRTQSIKGTIDSPYDIHTFVDGDAPVGLLPFPGRAGFSGLPLPVLDLDSFLVQLDDDPIIWTYDPNPDLDVQIQGSEVLITPLPGFTGQTDLVITATEQTANLKFASGVMSITVEAQPDPPVLSALPGEGILLQEEFSPFDLENFIIPPSPSCVSFDFYPEIIVSVPPATQPSWQFSGFYRSNMSVVARPVYTPGYVFQHPDDRLAVFVNGQIRGVALPTVISGQVYYFLTVAGGSAVAPMTVQFYSGHMKKIFMANYLSDYEPYLTLGTVDQPDLMDFSPITPVLGLNGNVEMIINDTTWTGSQVFHFIARDCMFPTYLADTTAATFCVQQSGTGYTTLYRDFDEDGFGDPAYGVQICGSSLAGWVTNPDDCFDSPVSATCPFYPSLDVPIGIDFNIPDTIMSDLQITDVGSISAIKVNNLRIDHTYIGDLRITLRSPAMTEVVLIDQRCGAVPDLLLDLDSESTNLYNDIPCPPNGGLCYQPLGDLGDFYGEDLNGTWTLIVEDLANGDGGALLSWGLQICYENCTQPGLVNTFTGGSGAWEDELRWSLGHAPSPCEHAIIDLNSQTDVVQIAPDVNIGVYRLTIKKGKLVLPASSLLRVKE
ncbi:MAG: proprotein convertase P-domain-containing protein [Saprospiraceae bacterium]|nr:proprotein convertase P-domain-containing protein [Saprospiraceae bacterium]